jgi:hypothetical protein
LRLRHAQHDDGSVVFERLAVQEGKERAKEEIEQKRQDVEYASSTEGLGTTTRTS